MGWDGGRGVVVTATTGAAGNLSKNDVGQSSRSPPPPPPPPQPAGHVIEVGGRAGGRSSN